MATFEYLAALVSVVVGLGIAQALRGAGHMIHARDSIQIYVPHLIWLISVILWMVVFWWFSFGLADLPVWELRDLAWVLFYAASIYFLVALLLPDPIPDDFDPRAHFHGTKAWFFGALFCVGLVEVGDYWVKVVYQGVLDPMEGMALFLYIAFLLTWLAGSVVAWRVRNEWFHLGFSIVFLAGVVSMALVQGGW
jgi:hypothetical protein